MSGPPPPPPVIAPVLDPDAARAVVAGAIARVQATIDRAASFDEDDLQQRVDDEWSTVESLRHLVLTVDLWLSRVIQGVADPFDPIALPPTFMPPTLFPGTSIDPDARPSFDEACAVVGARIEGLRSFVAGVTAEDLARPVDAHVGTVGGAVGLIVHELTAHDGFINRDLDRIEKGRTS